MKRFFLLFVVSVAFFLPPASTVAEDNSGPALWQLGDDDTTIYIFGTIHILNAGVNWQTPKVMDAFESADTVVFEIAPDQFHDSVIGPLLQKYGMLPQGEKLSDYVSEDTYAEIGDILNTLGAPANALDTLQPWVAASFLVVQSASQKGYLPQFGVDLTLMGKAMPKGVPIRGLETAEIQFSSFATLSMEDQGAYLEASLEDFEDLDSVFIEMRDAWMNKDLEKLDEMFVTDMAEFPVLAEAILYRRNRNWAEAVEAMLDEPGTFFIAVGTGHLVGEQNLILLLEQKGIAAERH